MGSLNNAHIYKPVLNVAMTLQGFDNALFTDLHVCQCNDAHLFYLSFMGAAAIRRYSALHEILIYTSAS